MKKLTIVFVLVGLGLWFYMNQPVSESSDLVTGSESTELATEMVAVAVPELSVQAKRGQGYFQAVCAACHGANAGGIDGNGPPLVHQLYVPGHHADIAISRAVKFGVQSHYWRFGNMPAVEGITDAELGDIIVFIREVQRANGIS